MTNRMSWKNLLSQESKSRRGRNKSINNNDLRTEFEKDYHRILISASFRRLQDKTQVFPLDKNDFVRTRLTHSIEVSSFAKSIAQSISNRLINDKMDEEFTQEDAGFISDILASAGLLHDIGNPPFGHFGEDTIRSWFNEKLDEITIENPVTNNMQKLSEILTPQMCEDFKNFEGNAQAIRLVSKLHFLIDENGMNLTYALLNTLIKYPGSSLEINKKSGDIKDKKMGYYFAEKDLFDSIIEETGTLNKKTGKISRHPLTFLLEAADDIAYSTADIEDGFKKDYITYEDLAKIVEPLKNEENPSLCCYQKLVYYKERAIEKNYEKPEMYAVQRWIIFAQGYMINSAVSSFINNYESIMHGEYKYDLFEETNSKELVKRLKGLAAKKIYKSFAIIKMEITAHNIISFFLEHFMKSVLYYDTPFNEKYLKGVDKRFLNIISDNYMHIYRYYTEKYIKNNEDESEEKLFAYKLYLRLLLVTDYICGMTDTYAKTLYQELTGII